MSTFASEIALALRGLSKRPAFTAVFVGTVALGIGAATIIFSAAHPILFAPLPYAKPEQVVRLAQTSNGNVDTRIGFNTIADLRERGRSMGPIAAVGSWQATISDGGDAAQYKGLRVSPEYFTVLGVKPALGRDFRESDDVPNSARMVIISDKIWRERFNSDRTVIERGIRLNDFPYTVVGVMPAGFEDVNEPEAEFWRPLQYTRTTNSSCRSCQHLRAIGRMKDGSTVDGVTVEVQGILASLGNEFPTEYPKGVGGVAQPLGDVLVKDVKPAMTAALAAVILVLLIACANATNLLLGRAAERRAEISVRTALGASRPRLVRQLLVESTMLATAGGLLGVAFAWAGLKGLIALAPAMFPRLAAIHINPSVLAASFVATSLIGLGFGLLPALEATRDSLSEGIQGASRRSVGGARRLRGALVASEMALAVLVLASSGLLLRSMRKLLDVDPGFNPKGVLTLQLNVVGQRFQDNEVNWRYYEDVMEKVAGVNGVTAVAYTSQLPLSDDYDQYGIHSERHPKANPSDDPSAHRYGVSPGYLEALGIPVLKGRTLTADDNGTSRDSVVLVNEAFAAKAFPGEEAIGQRVRIGDHASGPWRTVVGVTGNVHQVTLAGEVSPAVYHPDRQFRFADSPVSLVVRTTRDPESIAGEVRRAVSSIDRTQPILREMSMEKMVASSAGQRRFVLTLFEAFAILSAVLAALGMYGVLAGSVTERVREIGVREALGATPGQIIGMVLRQGMAMVAIGAATGVIMSGFVTKYIADQLFSVSRADPVTYALVFGVLGVVALVACAAPALRAARVDPMESLRAE